MPLTAQQMLHLEECWKAADLRWVNEKNRDQQTTLGEARRKNNSAAVLLAYEEAALNALRKRVKLCVQVAISELAAIGANIDKATEQLIMQRVQSLTSTNMPLSFPPGLSSTQSGSLPSVQQSYSRARARLRNELNRESENRIRSVRLKFESARGNIGQEQSMSVVHTYNMYGSSSRVNQNSTDNSVNVVGLPLLAALDELNRISANHVEAELAASNVRAAYPDKSSMATRLKEWASVAVMVEGLVEKAHQALPVIQTWLQNHQP